MGLIAEAPYPSSALFVAVAAACCAIAVAISFSGCLFLLSLRDHLLATDGRTDGRTDADGDEEETQDVLHRSLARPFAVARARRRSNGGTWCPSEWDNCSEASKGFSAFAI